MGDLCCLRVVGGCEVLGWRPSRLLLGKLVACGYVVCVCLGFGLPPWLTCVGGFVAGLVVGCLVY